MADGKIEIDIDVNGSKAVSQGKKAGDQIAKGVESGLKNVGKNADSAAKETEKSFQNAANSAKSSFSDVSSAAKNSFGDVGDAAKTAAGDAASAFESVPADASGAFSDVSSEAEAGFDGVADAASTASSDASSAFESIPSDAAGSFADVSDEARAGFSGVADAAESAAADASGAFEGTGEKSRGVFGTDIPASTAIAGAAVGVLAAQVLDIGKNAVQTGMDFDKSMAQVAATMGVSVDEVGNLRDFAKEMGETTAFSASQAADALNYMALAGYDAETSMRVLPTVLNLAAAGNMDLAAASDMVTDAQSALGLSVDEAEVMVDQMAKTSSKTNTSVSQLGSAFLTVGGTAKNLQGGTKELAQMLGILADNGVKGSEGGTALRNVILSLSAPTDKAAEAIEGLGLQVFDAEGNMRAMPDIFNDLNSAMQPLTQEEKTQVLNEIFNKVDLKSVNALLGTSAERFDEVAGAIDDAAGSAQNMANTQLDNLAGDVTLLESATEGFFIAVADQLTPALRDMTKFATNTVMPFLTNMAKNFDKIAPYILGAVAAIAGFVASQKILRAFRSETSLVGKSVKAMGLEFETASTKAKIGAVAVNGLKTALKGLQSIGILALFTALTEAITYFIDKSAKAKEHAEKLDSATRGLEDAASGASIKIGDASGALGEYGEAVKSVDMDELIQKQADLAESMRETQQEAANGQAVWSTYEDIIGEYAGQTGLTTDQVAKLQLAVDKVNDALGTSYTVVADQNGAYQIMADGIAVAKDELLNLIEAQKLQLQSEADLSGYEKAVANYNEQLDNLAEKKKAAAAATDTYNTVQEEYQKKLNKGEVSLEVYNSEVGKAKDAQDEANRELEDAQRLTDSAKESVDQYTDKITLNEMAAQENASALVKAAAANLEYRSGVKSAGVNLVDFTKALEDMGFTSDEIASMSQDDAARLASAWDKGYDEFQAATEETIHRVPEQLANMGEDAYNAAYGTGSDTGKGLSDGVSSEENNITKSSKDVVDGAVAEMSKAPDQAQEKGGMTTASFATGIASGMRSASSAGASVAGQATKGLGSKDNRPVGSTASGQFVSGVSEGQSKAKAAGEQVANAASKPMASVKDSSGRWGGDAGGNFASGLRGAIGVAKDAAGAFAQAIKSVLGHSVPEEGVLHEGGRGEALWGEHLVMNIAEGMTGQKAKRVISRASKEVAVDINRTLLREMEGIDPMAQLQESLLNGSAAFSMSAMMVGAAPTYTTNNQTLNFNGDIQSPDIIAREMRMQQHYGLVGRY